jgi:uncharacterized protein (TIGR03437 family)
MKIPARRLAAIAPSLVLSVFSLAAQQDRVPSQINRARHVVLSGRVPARARAGTDLGPVSPSFAMPDLVVMLKSSTTQQQALVQLIRNQQDPTSANYHQWLTPEQYADQFGVSQHDVAQVVQWLQSQGFTGVQVARSRMWVSFSGNAQQVQAAFGTPIDQYSVNGALHYANAADPSIPADLAPVIAGIRGLHNFRWKPRYHRQAAPQMTSSNGTHHIGPDDFATIYDVAPLYSAKVDGTGQSLIVVGQTNINTADIAAFRNQFGLGTINLQLILVPKTQDPGIVPGDEEESDLDIEWSSAVARNASIVFVYSNDVWQSAMYAVDQNLGKVLTMSYGACESYDLVDLPSFQQTVQQANAQGITWFAASGDSGATDCEDPNATIAQNGFAVDVPAAIPEVTGMGGTEFTEGAGSGYWNSNSNASALSYIPERVWNDTAADGVLAAGGGGSSIFFPQPSWQTGPSVPNDGTRHVPDLSFSASADHDGYYVYTGGSASYFGGTSVAAPTMAGIAALLNQYLVSTGAQSQPGLGNINPTLYRLAQNSNATEVFHDITVGDNGSPCADGTPNCTNGYVARVAGPGYDMASGLGSVDANNLVHSWTTQATVGSAVVASIDQNPVFELPAPDAKGNSWSYKLTLSEEAGIGTTLTGFTIDGASYTSQIPALFGSATIAGRQSISATLGFPSSSFTAHTVIFSFSGVDASNRGWTTQLSIPFTAPQTPLTLGGVSNAATGQQVYAPGEIVSVYGAGMGSMVQSAASIPLPMFLAGFEAYINNVQVPLYYVSPNQVNLQIPYETPTGQKSTLVIGNPYENSDPNFTITVAAAAPGIFMFPDGTINPFRSGKRGDTVTLYLTGAGAVRPSVATGDAPSGPTAPQPRLTPVTVTVGGVPATTTYVGIPSWSVGVLQINYTIPATAPTGLQPVVVTLGTFSSPPANFNVTQ